MVLQLVYVMLHLALWCYNSSLLCYTQIRGVTTHLCYATPSFAVLQLIFVMLHPALWCYNSSMLYYSKLCGVTTYLCYATPINTLDRNPKRSISNGGLCKHEKLIALREFIPPFKILDSELVANHTCNVLC